ncbi:MAG: class I SAM-dependent methyltransferase [Fibrobacteria bacterium]|nr:class I SAM-dependent methyltransferase [Fibrobacteria bacterium]
MDTKDSSSVWSALAPRWSELFPLRPDRIEMCRTRCGLGGTFLDVGCGDGALVETMLDAGRDAYGSDMDGKAVQRAKSRVGDRRERIQQASMTEVASLFPGTSFDLVVCLGQTFPHLVSDQDVRAFLVGARDRLAHDGSLLIQVMSDADLPAERELPAREIPGLRLERRRILDQGGERAHLELKATTEDGCSTWSVEHRVWTPESLSGMAFSVGLWAVSVAADESGREWTGREPGWILELARNAESRPW